MVAISRTVVYGSYTLPNVKTTHPRHIEPVIFNGTAIAWRESFTITGLIQANTNTAFQTALDAFLAGMKPTDLDQDFTITVVTDAVTKKRFEYTAASTNSYRRAQMTFTLDQTEAKTELSYPYTATFTWYPPNLTGTGGTEAAGSTTTNQRITYAINAAGYIQITKNGTIITAKGTSAKSEYENKIAATGYSDSVSSLKITSNLYKRNSHNYSSDIEDTRCQYTITETETPIQIDNFEDLRVNVTSRELNGILVMHATAEANILKSKYKQTNLVQAVQNTFRVSLETELKKVITAGLLGAILTRRDPIEWNSQTGRIRIGIHWTLPMPNGVMSFSVNRTLSKNPQNVFAATNSGYVSAQSEPLLQRVTYSGNMRVVSGFAFQALGLLKAIYPAPKANERQEGPLSWSKPAVANPIGDGFEASASWSITYRVLSAVEENITNISPTSWTGVSAVKSKYI